MLLFKLVRPGTKSYHIHSGYYHLTVRKPCDASGNANRQAEIDAACKQLSYRLSMPVTHYRRCPANSENYTTFPVCPRCRGSLEREYQSFCDNCGQRLNWAAYDYAVLLPWRR